MLYTGNTSAGGTYITTSHRATAWCLATNDVAITQCTAPNKEHSGKAVTSSNAIHSYSNRKLWMFLNVPGPYLASLSISHFRRYPTSPYSARNTYSIRKDWFTKCYVKLLARKVPTVMHKFNIRDTKYLKVHFHSDMFRWYIYNHHQGQKLHTERWDANDEVKSFLLCMHCQSHSTFFGVNSLSLMMVVYMPPKHVGVKVIL
jgi:hypothetical protein